MKKNLVLFFLLVFTLLPLVAAIFLYNNPHLLSGKKTAKGNLLVPPLDARSLLGESGRWQLVLVADEGCSSSCREVIYYAHQAHQALGKDRQRLRRKLVVLTQPELAAQEMLRDLDMEMIRTTELQLQEVFPPGSLPASSLVNSIFIVDPHGNLILWHPMVRDIDKAKDLVKDLKKLLRASRIG